MKKIFTLITVALVAFTVSTMAAPPTITLYSNRNYDVRIDGKTYNGNALIIPNLGRGFHTLQVFEIRSGYGLFGSGKRRTLVSSVQFELRQNDVTIDVTRNGIARISQERDRRDNRYGNNGRDWDKNRGDDGYYNRDRNNNYPKGRPGRD